MSYFIERKLEMTGIPSYSYFLEELRKLYTSKKFSDVLLEIFEENGTERHLYLYKCLSVPSSS